MQGTMYQGRGQCPGSQGLPQQSTRRTVVKQLLGNILAAGALPGAPGVRWPLGCALNALPVNMCTKVDELLGFQWRMLHQKGAGNCGKLPLAEHFV